MKKLSMTKMFVSNMAETMKTQDEKHADKVRRNDSSVLRNTIKYKYTHGILSQLEAFNALYNIVGELQLSDEYEYPFMRVQQYMKCVDFYFNM